MQKNKICQRTELLDAGFGPQTIYPRWVINTRAQPEPLFPRTIFAIAACMGKHSSASTSAYAGDQPGLHFGLILYWTGEQCKGFSFSVTASFLVSA